MIWLVLILLLVCSGVVSASETALFSLSRRALLKLEHAAGPFGRQVAHLMQHPRRVLMTILITNTAVNVAFFAVSFIALTRFGETDPAMAAVGNVGALLAVIMFGEIVPKALALSHAAAYARVAGTFIATLQVVLGPLRWILQILLVDPLVRLLAPSTATGPVTTDELRSLVEHSARDGVIGSQENDMLRSVVALADFDVNEVMTPRVDIQAISLNQSRDEIIETLRQSRRRKLPVYGADLDDIQGIVYARDIYLHPDAPLDTLVQAADFVPEQINLVQLIRFFRTEKTGFAIVVDEYGGTAGLVSMENLVERIVGELPDPDAVRPDPTTERIDESTYRVSGDLSVHLWADRFAVGEIDQRVDTVAGLVLAKLGRLPRVGDTVRMGNLTLTVEEVRKRRIEYVLLRRDQEPSTAHEER